MYSTSKCIHVCDSVHAIVTAVQVYMVCVFFVGSSGEHPVDAEPEKSGQ